MKDSDSEKRIFRNAIKKKMQKLAEHKKQGFKRMGLFVFYDELPISIKLESLKDCFDEVLSEYCDKYDIIYFGYPCGLIEYDILENVIQAKSIDRVDYNKLQYYTRLKIEA